MEVLANNPIALSESGQYFSYCTHDGQLKIWDTLSGRLKQEYTPSSHLSATCVTISWPPKATVSTDESSEVCLSIFDGILRLNIKICYFPNKGFAEKEAKKEDIK